MQLQSWRVRIAVVGILLCGGVAGLWFHRSRPVPQSVAIEPTPPEFESIIFCDIEPMLPFSDSDLDRAAKVPLDSRFIECFSSGKMQPHSFKWKGGLLGIARTKSGASCRIAVSYYGVFFAVVGQEGYYQLDASCTEEFDRYLPILIEQLRPSRQRDPTGNQKVYR